MSTHWHIFLPRLETGSELKRSLEQIQVTVARPVALRVGLTKTQNVVSTRRLDSPGPLVLPCPIVLTQHKPVIITSKGAGKIVPVP